jgi:hypothetical protein
MSTDLQSLIQQREAEAQAEQAKALEAKRRDDERRQRRVTLVQNFQLSIGTWAQVISGQFAGRLRQSAHIVSGAKDPASYEITYRRKAGAGLRDEAKIVFSIDDNNLARWRSSIGVPANGSAAFPDVTQQSVRALIEQFFAAALI